MSNEPQQPPYEYWRDRTIKLTSRVEELMDSNYKWQEKCGDLERENEKLHSLMEELEMMIRSRDATIKEMRIERGRLNHAVDEELTRLREMVREMQAVLHDWNIAWISDCITLVENGNVCNGIDEGLEMGRRYMTPLLEKTRLFLPVPPEVEG